MILLPTPEGGPIVATVRGVGPPTLLLHGLPGDRHVWDACGARLDLTRSVITPDLLGFGDSGPLPDRAHAEVEARAVLGLLDHLGVERCDVVGHDFGGPVALWLWILAPARVRSLALLATNTFSDTPIPYPLRPLLLPVVGETMVRGMFSRTGMRALWWSATGDRTVYPFAAFERLIDARAGRVTARRLLLHSLRELSALYRRVEEALPTLWIPTLVLWGDRDPFFPVAQGRRLAQCIPSAGFRLLRGAGHFLPEERPAEVAEMLNAFWRSTAPS